MAEINERKFCFIICVNNENYFSECVRYIDRLTVPEGYEIDLLTVDDASSMAEGYEEARLSTDARYKIYIHQDTFIVNENFLEDLLKIFKSNRKIGAVGVMGSKDILGNRVSKLKEVYGDVISQNWRENSYTDGKAYKDRYTNTIEGTYEEVGCLWGCMIATQYDIEWEKLYENDWIYYPVTFSLKMQKAGYKTVVAKQDKPWCIHDGNNEGLSFKKEIIKELKGRFENLTDDRFFKRVLICNSEIFYPTMENALNRQGFCAEAYNERITFLSINQELIERLDEWVSLNDYKYIFSFNFSPNVAEAAKKNGVKYISWAWDAPLESHSFNSTKYETSLLYTFDKHECEKLRRKGVGRMEHLPLVTDVTDASALVITREDKQKYSHDVSFIGQMYSDEFIKSVEDNYTDESKRKIRDLLTNELCDWRDPEKVFEYIDKDFFDDFYKHFQKSNSEYYNDSHLFIKLFRSMAHPERVEVLNRLAQRFKVDIYTKGDTSELVNVNIHEPVHNLTVAPKIFHLSKINLNITTRNIRTGVPLRVFDIMGVGGFVLTNYQKEIEDLFVEDKEIVCFRTIDELIEKTEYYLSHDRQREEIAVNGFNRVKKDYNYEKAIERMFK